MRNNILVGLLALLCWGCKKEGFIPPPEGKEVAYTDTLTITLSAALEKAPVSLFNTAWKRSHMPEYLKSLSDGKTMFTILALSDAALKEKGYTEQKIQSMAQTDLDSLLMFYVVRQRISKENLVEKSDNLVTISLLNKPGVRLPRYLNGTPGPSSSDPYYYRHYLQLVDQQLFIDGKPAGSGASIAAKDGYIWLLDHMVERPDKTVLEALRADGRFTIIVGISKQNAVFISKLYHDFFGWPLEENPLDADLYLGFNWVLKPDNPFLSNTGPNTYFSTYFIPTDDAFKAAGMNSLADVHEFNRRKGLPYVNEEWYAIFGEFATNTLLDYHYNWGLTVNSADPAYRNGGMVFFSPMLTSATVANFPVVGKSVEANSPESDPSYYMPYKFWKDGSGKIHIKVKDAEGEGATITGTDINTLMGPIHAVDHLLIPKGYKID